MEHKKLLTIFTLVLIVLFTGCRKDDFVGNVGVCPLVISTDPADGATGVPFNKVITATFNVEMNPATITTTSFTIAEEAKGEMLTEGVVTYSGKTATFTPSSPLDPNTTYTGTIKRSVKGLTGLALQEDYVWTFKTATVPTVTLVDPLNLATTVALNKVVSATFSEAMDPLTITASTFTLMNGPVPVSGVVTYSGTSATFTPGSPLLLGKTYTATIKTGAKSITGVALASNYIWTFSTGALIAPTVISTDPLNLATNVVLTKVISATFSVAMDPATITNATFKLMDGLTPVTGVVTYSGTTATFTPGSPLLSGKSYTTTITTGVKNLAGTAMVNNYVWAFSTGAVVAPTVIDTDPLDLAIDVPLNQLVSATFSVPMDPLTITTSTFTLMDGVTPVTGTVAYSGIVATFTPDSPLPAGKTYTATITTGAKNVAGTAMVNDYVWNFTTPYSLTVAAVNGAVAKFPDQPTYNYGTSVQITAIPDLGYDFDSWSGDGSGIINPLNVIMDANKIITANFILAPVSACPPIVDLGTAGNYVILAESGISTTGVTQVTGNMGINPAAATFITGFGLILPAGSSFSTSSLVVGKVYAPDYAAPTPANLVTATGDMHTAYTTANGLVVPAPTNEFMAGNLNGQTLTAGIYKWSSNVGVTNGIILDGGGDNCATFIFQIAGDLTVANSAIITLQNGAQAKNIFWVVAGSGAVLGTGVDFSGNILCKTLISLNTGAKINGRLLAQTAVTLNAATVVKP